MSDSNGQFEKQAIDFKAAVPALKAVYPYIAGTLGGMAVGDTADVYLTGKYRDRSALGKVPVIGTIAEGDVADRTGLLMAAIPSAIGGHNWRKANKIKAERLAAERTMRAERAAKNPKNPELTSTQRKKLNEMDTAASSARDSAAKWITSGSFGKVLMSQGLRTLHAGEQESIANTALIKKYLEGADKPQNITGTLTTNSPGVEQGLNNVAEATHAVADATAKAQKEAPKANNPTVPQKVDTTVTVKNNWMPWVAGAIGAGALGLGGAALYRYLTSRDRGQGAKIQYRMEGKKGDPWSEALVDVPIRTPRLSPKIKDTLESGLKRQVSKNIKYMSTKRDPNTGKRISYEDWQRLYGEEEDSAEKTPDNEYTDKLNKKYEKAASVLDVEDKTKVEKGALSNKYKENNGSWSEAGTTTKVAATREWAEGSGAILNALLSGGVGAMAGREIAQKNGKNSLYGMLLGGAAGLAPSVIGSMLGHVVGDRTPSAQLKHDDKGAGPEFLVPGYAMYNSARRNPRAIQMLTPALQEAYKGEDEDEDDWEDDDFDKEAAASQSVPPSTQPQAQPGPPPQTPLPGGGAPVQPSTTGQAQGPGDAANALQGDPSAKKALSAINSIGGMLGVQVNTVAAQKQMA